jgi:hypothetical protein
MRNRRGINKGADTNIKKQAANPRQRRISIENIGPRTSLMESLTSGSSLELLSVSVPDLSRGLRSRKSQEKEL